MRATLAKKRDRRSRWSGGSSACDSVQNKSWGSWRREDAGKKAQQLEDSRRGKSVEDLELRDDGSSPLKLMPGSTKEGAVPKKLSFGDSMSTGKESRVEPVVGQGD